MLFALRQRVPTHVRYTYSHKTSAHPHNQGELSHQGHVFTMLHNMAALQAFCKHIGSVRKQALSVCRCVRLCVCVCVCVSVSVPVCLFPSLFLCVCVLRAHRHACAHAFVHMPYKNYTRTPLPRFIILYFIYLFQISCKCVLEECIDDLIRRWSRVRLELPTLVA